MVLVCSDISVFQPQPPRCPATGWLHDVHRVKHRFNRAVAGRVEEQLLLRKVLEEFGACGVLSRADALERWTDSGSRSDLPAGKALPSFAYEWRLTHDGVTRRCRFRSGECGFSDGLPIGPY